MNSARELNRWILGAAAELGDPARAICHLYFRWLILHEVRSDELVAYSDANDPTGTIILDMGRAQLPLPVQLGQQELNYADEIERYGMQHIARGLWTLRPSLNLPGALHAFITFYDVPEPAPWERRIVLASEVA